MEIKIKKRDGTTEDYSYDKLITSIVKAGVPIDQGKILASEVEEWLRVQGKTSLVASTQVGDKIIEVLSHDFPVESENYKAYKK